MLSLCPISLKEANAFVAQLHRHHKPVPGHKFSIAVTDGERVRGVAIIGRPVARHADNGATLEVNRVCTDGAKNACSMLYGAAWRATKALGHGRLITYTQSDEGGASLRAAGWSVVAELDQRRGWDTPSRPRDNATYLSTTRTLWEAS